MRAFCTQTAQAARSLTLHPQAAFEVLQAARAWYRSAKGQERYQRRAGVEGTLSQGVRGFGLRYARYRGLTQTHFQHIATAAAMNVERIVAWLNERPRASRARRALRRWRPPVACPKPLLPSVMPLDLARPSTLCATTNMMKVVSPQAERTEFGSGPSIALPARWPPPLCRVGQQYRAVLLKILVPRRAPTGCHFQNFPDSWANGIKIAIIHWIKGV
jgi:Transposase DDE domain